MTVVGTPLTQEEIRTGGSVYGGPNEKNIIRVNLPVQMYYTDENGKRAKASVAVNKLAAKPLIDAFTEVSSIYGNNVDGLKLNDYGGGWCVKKVQGSDNYSMHSYGLAIDINPSENSYDTTTDNATLSGE